MQANCSNLEDVVESILFVSGQGVELKDIAEKLEVDVENVKHAVESLKKKHENTGINVITFKGCAQLCSNPNYADQVATVLNPIKEKLLTKAALETLAIIAYKQPVTRLDIEQVRGVNSDYAMQVLQNFNLIEVVGRKDAIGKPLLFGTTNEFLKRFELQTIQDLPDYDELLERIEVIHADQSLYRSTEIVPEEELDDAQNSLQKTEDLPAKNVQNSTVQKNAQISTSGKSSDNKTLPKFDENYVKQTLIDAGSDVISSKDEDFL